MAQQVNSETACEFGIVQYHNDGVLSRVDGPAVIWPTGRKEWWFNGQLHCETGPAIEDPALGQVWYKNGKRHRDNGPAVVMKSGRKEWWVDGVRIN